MPFQLLDDPKEQEIHVISIRRFMKTQPVRYTLNYEKKTIQMEQPINSNPTNLLTYTFFLRRKIHLLAHYIVSVPTMERGQVLKGHVLD